MGRSFCGRYRFVTYGSPLEGMTGEEFFVLSIRWLGHGLASGFNVFPIFAAGGCPCVGGIYAGAMTCFWVEVGV